MNIDERISKLEKRYKCPAGTTLTRVFVPPPELGMKWCLVLGRLDSAKDMYYGNTIEEVLKNAEANADKEISWSDLGIKL